MTSNETQRPKRILILSLAYYPKHIGGAEVAIKEITDRTDPAAYEFHMICLRFDRTLPRTEKIGNVTVHRIGLTKRSPSTNDLKKFPLHLNKFIFQFSAFWKARKLHRGHNFDGIWGMMAHATAVPCGLFKRRYPSIGYVLTLQEGDPPEYIEKKMKPLWPLFVRGFRTPDVIQTISSFLGTWARKMGYDGDIEVIPNAVNVAHFSHTHPQGELEELRRALNMHKSNTYLITTSRLVHKNGIDDVIRGLSYLPKSVEFLILGDGPDRAKLERLTRELGVETRVHFLGQVDHSEMPKYLQVSDIFIRPSRSEGMGNSFIEAMAAGLPVIATHEGGIPDFLFDAKRNPDKQTTGWAVDPDSPEQIAETVEDIRNDSQKVAEVRENAQKLVREQYDWDIIAERMERDIFSRITHT